MNNYKLQTKSGTRTNARKSNDGNRNENVSLSIPALKLLQKTCMISMCMWCLCMCLSFLINRSALFHLKRVSYALNDTNRN